ncbi:hypothetical protein AVEN_72414-1 [Araneus ventricosus]|uniref:Uncharacterized protein n=1 Tax=Araneus ventricosus TaxID=182803 RepID=A0A4Y2IK69_ARAVE|nr:hypothetical protein AVEN_72414-1 [Araneus ventricosus]
MLVRRLSPRWSLLALHPSWAGRASVGIFAPHCGRLLDPRQIYVHQADKHRGSSVVSGIEPESLRCRDLTTRPPQPSKIRY